MSAGPRALSWEDCKPVLSTLGTADVELFLIGGQAVAFWVDYLRLYERAPLAASKDLDLLGHKGHVLRVASLLNGTPHVPKIDHITPESGYVTYDPDGRGEIRIDFLPQSPPNSHQEVRDSAVRFDFRWGDGKPITIGVMHPFACLKSRIHNVVKLPHAYRNEHGLSQLSAAFVIMETFLTNLLAENQIDKAKRLNKALRTFSTSALARDLWHQHSIEVFALVLKGPELGSDYQTKCYPRWKQENEKSRRPRRTTQLGHR